MLICECIKFRGYKFLWLNLDEPHHQKLSGHLVSSVRSKILWWTKLDTFTKPSHGHFHVGLQCIEKDGYTRRSMLANERVPRPWVRRHV